MEYRIIFDVKEGNKTVVFGKEFQELKHAFDWADWFLSKHTWAREYKIKPLLNERRKGKNAKFSSRERKNYF